MFNIRFYNEYGSVDFGGGESESVWKITKADGLAFCSRTFSCARYTDQEGQTTTNVSVNARTITLAGDIFCGNNNSDSILNSAMTVLEEDGILEINTAIGKRIISARCCDFNQGERKGRYMLFTIQFLCDDPYFEDADKTEVAVYREIPYLDKDFTFPGVFSERISRSNIEYSGTRKAYPVFYIYIEQGVVGDNRLEIKNHTSGESLTFDYGGVMGEFITVDTKKRKIYNQEGTNLIKYLTDDSFFDGFHLYPGNNDIEVINRNTNTGISVNCSFANRYCEAVYI